MKVGLLGYGFMGGAHLAALQRIEGVEVTAVSSRRRPSADGPARGNLDLKSGPLPETVAWHSDWHSIVSDPAIDAVDVCLPTDMHREVVLAALAAGKHVLCEKPMALTVEDCVEMQAAAKTSGRVFMVGQVVRFMWPYRYAAKFVQEAGRSKMKQCVLRRSAGFPQWGGWLTDQKRSGGAILDMLSHDLDYALHLFGRPQSFFAESIGPVDTMQGVLRYEDGLVVKVEGGWVASESPFSAGFEVEAGDDLLTFQENVLSRKRSDGEVFPVDIPEHDPYFEEVAYFIDCCRRNVSPALCPPDESAKAVELSLQLMASRDAGGKDVTWKA
ncbi:MAG: Gfo/Idh/MocA family oxidoreductase [Acidobacteria bacterium]|nr:Gfo/Idh/MocA family oxidoreductase [Acidobacteriota bacterium]